MRAGLVGLQEGGDQYVQSVSEVVSASEDLEQCLSVERVFSLPSGAPAFEGLAAREVRRRHETATIDGDEVTVAEETRTETVHVPVAGLGGEFVVVGSSRGEFAFDMVADQVGTAVERATLDLDGLFDECDDGRPWKVGVAGGGDDGLSGVFHGEDLRRQYNLGDLRAGTTLTQLGLTYTVGGRDVKMTATRGGYVEVYQPSSFDTGDYLEYIRDEVVPHVER